MHAVIYAIIKVACCCYILIFANILYLFHCVVYISS
uniref:Uncharacterized protein n=1 Tax=Ciona intestinalis TaxID=7719 RepID=H2Y3Q4_CIOIN